MSSYRFVFRLSPPGLFGLPEGERVVVPATPKPRHLKGSVLDTRSGKIVAHGTLSQYREEDQAASGQVDMAGFLLSLQDNFLEVIVEDADGAQSAADRSLVYVDTLLQSLSAMYGERFSAALLVSEDDAGVQQQVRANPRNIRLMAVTVYNNQELSERFARAAAWAAVVDDVAHKALFYFEHACLLNEFSQTLSLSSPHAAFSRASAFLQLFKALTTIIGDPSSDRDYQSRCKRIGLQKDFWQTKAKPLYDIRNDADVAHYSHALPEPGAFLGQYSQAVTVFREALDAYMNFLQIERRGECGR